MSAKVRCIALDLDGTTIYGFHPISPGNRKAIEDAAAAGVQVVIASGRPLKALPGSVTEIPAIRYAIVSNGAAVYDLQSGERLHHAGLTERNLKWLLQFSRKYRSTGKVAREVFVDGQSYTEKSYWEDPVPYGAKPAVRQYVKKTRTAVEDAGMDAFILRYRGSLDGMDLIVGDPDLRHRMMEEIRQSGEEIYMTASVNNRIELSSPEAGKRSGLRFLLRYLDIPEEKSAAFGDMDNDIDMIQMAGYGIAVGDASESCRKAADYVTKDCADDGVAWAFYHILDIPER